MRNAVLPTISSDIYNFGSNEVQMSNSGISMDSKLNIYGSSFSLESEAFSDFTIPYHDQHYQSGIYHLTSLNRDNNAQQPIISQDFDFQSTSTRKRSFDAISPFSQGGINDQIKSKGSFSEWEKYKRRKSTSSQEQWHHKVKESIKNKIPVRKSQKLSDKITSLQKLVSPYGKTDTASVLQEASLYIKLLQQQIQNLFQMLSTTCPSQNIDGRLLDLQSRGICLFPVSVMQRLSQPHYASTSNANSFDSIVSKKF
ncbi:transcription factor bHLH112-like [Mercurialis annua]|uniref:transcription factor bHLH112-like n=1 Tax=Mercurialis annua TaxID=3986 RepID=UPI002160CDB4|nr:transcription factor bHLH112-like [Mercurialis annua]